MADVEKPDIDEDEAVDIPLFDPSMKKKKKKKKKVEDVEETPDATPEEPEEDAEPPADEEDDEDDDLALNFGKKKKKKKKKVVEEADEENEDGEVEDNVAAWDGTDREYTYKELLDRVFTILEQSNPDLVSKKRSRMIMQPPSVFREGTKKTVWANFREICKSLGRSTEHVQAFALAELGTNGSVDGSHRLVIKGRFNPKQIESVIKHYITEYVTCRTCKSHETNLKKENRIYFVQCRACGSSRSVAPIKTGFQAQVTKRRRRKV